MSVTVTIIIFFIDMIIYLCLPRPLQLISTILAFLFQIHLVFGMKQLK